MGGKRLGVQEPEGVSALGTDEFGAAALTPSLLHPGVRTWEATSQPKTPGWDADCATTRPHRSHFMCHHGIRLSISPK